jgi:hypothetical protein
MRWLSLLFFVALGAAPLHIVSVGRTGPPPYEGNARVYRLEGDDYASLRVGEVVSLRREGEKRRLGRLEILSIRVGYAQAKLVEPEEGFPLKGDLVIRTQALRPLPSLSRPTEPASLPTAANLKSLSTTANPKLPAVASSLPSPPHAGPNFREPIYFLKGDASLSPGAQVKLRAWVAAWGTHHRWAMECPQPAGTLSTLLQGRLSALREELQRLGVSQVEVRPVPPDPPGRYEAIYVVNEPW